MCSLWPWQTLLLNLNSHNLFLWNVLTSFDWHWTIKNKSVVYFLLVQSLDKFIRVKFASDYMWSKQASKQASKEASNKIPSNESSLLILELNWSNMSLEASTGRFWSIKDKYFLFFNVLAMFLFWSLSLVFPDVNKAAAANFNLQKIPIFWNFYSKS